MERARVFARMFDYAALSEDQIRFRVSIYYGMIRFIDDAVGRMLDALARPAWPRTRSSSSPPTTATTPASTG